MNDTAFLKSVRAKFGSRSGDYVADFMPAAGLPIPSSDQFYESIESDDRLKKIILFLQPFGIAIRFYEPLYIPENDHILQPLVKYEADHMDVDIVPIVPVGIRYDDLEKLRQTLYRLGVGWGDSASHNAGYALNGRFHPVITDICESVSYHNFPYSTRSDDCTIQDRIFAPLKKSACDYLDSEGLPKAAIAQIFKREKSGYSFHSGMLSREFVQAGDDHPQTIRAYHGALSYAREISHLIYA